MNPRARRLRTRRRQARIRLTKLVCLHEPERYVGLPLPSGANWDPAPGADTLTWGHTRIQAQDVRIRRWNWKHGGTQLTPQAREQLARFMGPHLSGFLTEKRPTFQERYYRRIES